MNRDTSCITVLYRLVILDFQLVSCGADGVWSVWTLRNNEIIYRDDAHADKIWGLAVIGDGSCIVTGSSDATVRIWDDVTVEVIAQQVCL